MNVLTGKLSSILGSPFGGPGYAVLIKSKMTRRSSGGSVILPLIDRISMPAEEDGGTGEFTTTLLDPGPIRVELSGSDRHGDGWDITIPEGPGPFELADLIDAQTEWSPMVVSRAEAAARRAEQGAVTSTEQATLANQHREAAEDADESAHNAAGAAAEETKALIRDEMDEKVSEADGHAQSAGQSASLAGTHAQATGDDRRQTGLDRQATGGDVDDSVALAAAVIAAAGLVEGMIAGIGVRSPMPLVWWGTGTPELADFPDAQKDDVIIRYTDKQEWRVDES